ncbi:unnamed protein product [Amoebophrya sp. A120]|nr:unnamed protein product [Amoebophrya sp. A120]|eukprot:GSA120T00001643001.1
MGSQFGTPLSNGFALATETAFQSGNRLLTARRFADDKFAIKAAGSAADTMVEHFYPGCRLVLDTSTPLKVCGLLVHILGTTINTEATLTGKPFASAYSAGMQKRQRGVVRGHLARLKLSSTIFPKTALLGTICMLTQQGYSAKILQQELMRCLDDMRELYMNRRGVG